MILVFINNKLNTIDTVLPILLEMKEKYDNGFIILLQNERFKLIHSHGDYEVWAFSSKEA